jgi:hypothetical protein
MAGLSEDEMRLTSERGPLGEQLQTRTPESLRGSVTPSVTDEELVEPLETAWDAAAT